MATATETKIDDAIADAAAEKAYAAAAETATEPKPVDAPVTAKAPVAKVAAKKAVPAPKKAAKAKPVKASVKKIAKPAAKAAVKLPTFTKIKDKIMTTTTEDFTAKAKEAVADMQTRAKAAYDKGTALFGEMSEFSKGNVEALVESGKILAAGLQDMGKDYVAEGKSAFETMTADVKELAAIKSPADFFKLQGEILRRNFDAAVASGSKHSEALVKLANDTYAPLSNRVSLAIEKVKQAA